MRDLETLTPIELATLCGRPEGELGVVIATRINRTNRMVIDAVYRRLGLTRGCHVLEIGFGNGGLLPALMLHAEAMTYTGVDISPTMVAEATRLNQALVAAGSAVFHLASAAAIPVADSSVDRVFAVNSFYFWPQPVRVLAEIRRVLRPGGTSIIAAIDPETAASVPFARDELGFRVRDGSVLEALHREAGFGRVTVEIYEEVTTRPDGIPWPRRYNVVVAQA